MQSMTMWICLRVLALVTFVVALFWRDLHTSFDVSAYCKNSIYDVRSFLSQLPAAAVSHNEANASLQKGDRVSAKIHLVKVGK